ncbi:MAG: ATP-grasp fold amidoligase family protein [Methanosarcina mazei]
MKSILHEAINVVTSQFDYESRIKCEYLLNKKKLLSSKNSKSFSEKIIYRRVYPLSIFSLLADKIAVREYVKKKGGEKYLIPLYGTYDRLTIEDINRLPESFVLKANHGCGLNKIVLNKSKEDINRLIEEANGWLEIDYSKVFGEKHYERIRPMLLAEKLLLNHNKIPEDYKIHVFNRFDKREQFIFIQVISNRYGDQKRYLVSRDWTPLPFEIVDFATNVNIKCENKPTCLGEMLNVAKILSESFGYCRIDLYAIGDKVYFGEMTFTPRGGSFIFNPPNWDLILGEKFGWPEKDFCI